MAPISSLSTEGWKNSHLDLQTPTAQSILFQVLSCGIQVFQMLLLSLSSDKVVVQIALNSRQSTQYLVHWKRAGAEVMPNGSPQYL